MRPDCRAGLLLLAVVWITPACDGGGQRGDDWTIPVAPGTRTVEVPAAFLHQRQGRRIGMEKELAIDPAVAAGSSAAGAPFRFPRDVEVDDAGRIYVLDGGNDRVRVFEAGGAPVRNLGTAGPARLERPYSMILSRGEIVVDDAASGRLLVWGVDGRHLRDVPLGDRVLVGFVAALAPPDEGGEPAWLAYVEGPGSASQGSRRELVVMRQDGRVERSLAALGYSNPPVFQRGGARVSTYTPRPVPSFAGTPEGEVYLTASAEYEVLAMDARGAQRWALRVPWARPRVPDSEVDRVLLVLRRNFPDVRRSEVNLPDRVPALSRIEVDGHGHLYVFPYVSVTDPPELRPVDVYSRDGERLFAGMIPNVPWDEARGDHVYGAVRDPDATTRVYRWRLQEPF